MDITGIDYRNGHYAMVLSALNVFHLHKMYFCSHTNSLHKIKFISAAPEAERLRALIFHYCT